ncbi:MAG: dephospho-CoA kinase [Rhodoglobus sp.]
MFLIGLTGGIASGKSTVAARLAEHGAVRVDADVIAREVVEPGTEGLAAIEREFGASVISADGTLNRPALGAIIFADDDKRATLNAITHPAVWRRAKEMFAAAEAANPSAVVVYDVPLLAEAKASRPIQFDLVVVVDASRETRLSRLVELRGLSPEEAALRFNSQASDAERLAIADVVIDSNGSLEQTIRQTDELWEQAYQSAVGAQTP